jgi:hypothetical protein
MASLFDGNLLNIVGKLFLKLGGLMLKSEDCVQIRHEGIVLDVC